MSQLVSAEPRLEQREARHYAGIAARVPMPDLPTQLPKLFDELYGWLAQRSLSDDGPALIRYNVIDMERALEIEVGAPLAERVEGDGRVAPGVIPAGSYATVLYRGHPAGLMAATAALLDWATKNGVEWQTSQVNDEEVWAGRFEFYLTDPDEEPNMDNWETELAFLTR